MSEDEEPGKLAKIIGTVKSIIPFVFNEIEQPSEVERVESVSVDEDKNQAPAQDIPEPDEPRTFD